MVDSSFFFPPSREFVGLFEKVKLRVNVRLRGRVPPSQSNHLTIESEARTDERFEKSRWDSISISNARLDRCVFVDIHTQSANFGGGRSQSIYTDCVFEACELVFGVIGNARFVRCRFNSCQLSHIFGTKLELIDCSFPGTKIEKAVFHGVFHAATLQEATRERNEFCGNDFSAADLVDVDFRGQIDLTNQLLPAGKDYVYVSDTRRASEVARLVAQLDSESPGGKRAVSIERMMKSYAASGQRQALLRLTDFEALAEQFRKELR